MHNKYLKIIKYNQLGKKRLRIKSNCFILIKKIKAFTLLTQDLLVDVWLKGKHQLIN